jgi:hypothetical protein
MATANARTARRRVAWKRTIPTSRFQPAWRLGKAAYLFVSAGGCSARYPSEYSVTVSTTAGSASRGGATGNPAKNANPSRPETNIAFRRRTYRSRRQTKSATPQAAITGQWP